MDALARFPQSWSGWVLATSWQVALLVALIALVSSLMGRFPARFRHALWLLVLVKAFTPPSLTAPWSVGNWGVGPLWRWTQSRMPVSLESSEREGPFGVATNADLPALEGENRSTAIPPLPSKPSHSDNATERIRRWGPWTPAELAFAAWIAGLVAYGCFVALQHARLSRALRPARTVDEGPLRVMLERLALKFGDRPAPDLLLSDNVSSPLLFGLFRPRIVLPVSLAETLASEELEDLLLHELTHWHRRDLLVGWAQVIAQGLLWFHPFLWFANARLRHERECACDEAVVGLGQGTPRRYGESLLKAVLAARARPAAALGFPGIFERGGRLQNRLEAIMNRTKPNPRFRPLGWAFVALFAVGFIPMASPRVESQPMAQGNPGAAKQEAAGDSLAQRLSKNVTVDAERSPDGDRLTVQYAAIAICEKAGIPYLWKKSQELGGDACKRYIEPFRVKDVSAETALRDLLAPLGLRFDLDEEGLYLCRADTARSEKAPSSERSSAESEPVEPARVAMPGGCEVLKYDDGRCDGKLSIGASGHAVEFGGQAGPHFVEAVQIAASRDGDPEPPQEDFHLYILNKKKQVLADLKFPYGTIERGTMRWYTLRTPSVEVPEEFLIALAFNPKEKKGIYLGLNSVSGGEGELIVLRDKTKGLYAKTVPPLGRDGGVAIPKVSSHSFTGLPAEGYEPYKGIYEGTYDWMVRVALSEKPSGEKGIVKLADFKPPVSANPFDGCTEIKNDTGKSDDKQSYGGSGPAILFDLAGAGLAKSGAAPAYDQLVFKGVRLYAGRYGSGYDPEQTYVDVAILDSKDKVRWQGRFPYGLFSYKTRWVDLALSQPIALSELVNEDGILSVALNPQAHQTKGIYFHYNKNPKKSHSFAGTVEQGLKSIPDREWIIRVYVAPK